MGELSCDQVRRLEARYQPDLTLFQYSMDHIYQWAHGGLGCQQPSGQLETQNPE